MQHTPRIQTGPTPAGGGPGRKILATDPVCGMQVDPTTARYRVEGARVGRPGAVFHFCSPTCQTKFIQAPAQFLKGQRVSMPEMVTQETQSRNLLVWFMTGVGFLVLFIVTPLLTSGIGLPGWFNGLVYGSFGLMILFLYLFDAFWNDRFTVIAAGTVVATVSVLWSIFSSQLPPMLGGVFGLMVAAAVLLTGASFAVVGWKAEIALRKYRFPFYIAWVAGTLIFLAAIALTIPPPPPKFG